MINLDGRPDWVLDEVFDLFAALDASEEQLDFKVLYGSAKQGWMADDAEGPKVDMGPLLDLVLEHVEEPKVEEGEFRMLATTIEANPYLGRILTGRITSGKAVLNQPIHALSQDGTIVEQGRITQILSFDGLERKSIDSASAGDIVAIAGLSKATVADTLVAPGIKEPIEAQPIDPPTLSMTFACEQWTIGWA